MSKVINWEKEIPAFLTALAHAFRPPCNLCRRFDKLGKPSWNIGSNKTAPFTNSNLQNLKSAHFEFPMEFAFLYLQYVV